MTNCLNLYKVLKYHCYKVQMCATQDVTLDAWVGAIIRNNLLYASEQIRVQKTGRSLREQIDALPLTETHPLYKELKEGFPKGYVLTEFSHAGRVSIKKDERLTFSLLLIGNMNDYRYYFFEAIKEMCARGIGKPMTPFQLTDISEIAESPVSLSGFLQPENNPEEIVIRFLTPAILFRLKDKKNNQLSYQDKSNRFPCFYQLVRSSFARLQKLYALYADTNDGSPERFDEKVMENYLEKAGQPLLKSANIQYIFLQNTLKKGGKNEMPLAGYIGEQAYAGNFQPYLPLLKFMSFLGVGNETVYGMGRFEIEEQHDRYRIDENQKIEVESEINCIYHLDDHTNQQMPESLKLPQLIVRFKNQIAQKEIPDFAKAMAEKTNNELITGNIPYCYPVIQFKRINGQAAIVCIGEGTEQIGGFFSAAIGKMKNEEEIEIETLKADKITVKAWAGDFTYSIRKYLPLSSEHYAEYLSIKNERLRRDFIGKILKANIQLFAKRIGVGFDREVICVIKELEAKATVRYKNHSFASFDLIFSTNVSLPNFIGLGIGVSHGFGTVVRNEK